ncbi:hypothetical protein Tco_0528751 [Tanacetum coccineum]
MVDHLTKGLARDLVHKSAIGMGLKSIKISDDETPNSLLANSRSCIQCGKLIFSDWSTLNIIIPRYVLGSAVDVSNRFTALPSIDICVHRGRKILTTDKLYDNWGGEDHMIYNVKTRHFGVVPKVDDVSLVDGVFDGAFGGEGEEDVVMGEGVVVTSSSLEILTNNCLGGIMVSLIFLEGLEEEA